MCAGGESVAVLVVCRCAWAARHRNSVARQMQSERCCGCDTVSDWESQPRCQSVLAATPRLCPILEDTRSYLNAPHHVNRHLHVGRWLGERVVGRTRSHSTRIRLFLFSTSRQAYRSSPSS